MFLSYRVYHVSDGPSFYPGLDDIANRVFYIVTSFPVIAGDFAGGILWFELVELKDARHVPQPVTQARVCAKYGANRCS